MGKVVAYRPRQNTPPKGPWRKAVEAAAVTLVMAAAVGLGWMAGGPVATLPSLSHKAVSKFTVEGHGFTRCGVVRDHCVIDGDTIRYGGVRIRVEDIDAPETHEPRCESELALGERATWRLIELVNAGPFEIVYTGGRNHDVYGRDLRRLERNGKSLGGILVEEGLARRWDGARHPWC